MATSTLRVWILLLTALFGSAVSSGSEVVVSSSSETSRDDPQEAAKTEPKQSENVVKERFKSVSIPLVNIKDVSTEFGSRAAAEYCA